MSDNNINLILEFTTFCNDIPTLLNQNTLFSFQYIISYNLCDLLSTYFVSLINVWLLGNPLRITHLVFNEFFSRQLSTRHLLNISVLIVLSYLNNLFCWFYLSLVRACNWMRNLDTVLFTYPIPLPPTDTKTLPKQQNK